MTTSTSVMRAIERRGFLRQAALDVSYNLTCFPIALIRFVLLIALFCSGAALAIVFVGLPIVVLTLYVARGFADVERLQLRWVLNRRVRRPRYRSREGRRGLPALLTPVTEAQSWLDFLHGILGFIPVLVAFCLTVTWWSTGLAGSLYFLWGWIPPPGHGPSGHVWPDGLGFPRTYLFDAASFTVIGLLFLASAPFVTRGMAMLTAAFAWVMLTRERVTALEDRIEELSGSRDAAVSAEASALRKLERDIHDGPQQRLVRLAMDLSLAERRMRTDPEAARPLLAEAIRQSKETLEELRALSRGIAPPILADRGLSAALTAVAARSPVPVELDMSLPVGVRLPEAVETTAYFLVAEALTNVAKHSGAERCDVQVRQDGRLLHVKVFDNGLGGAHAGKGHGLAGLADRVRAVDGRFDLSSPAGGPTILTARLPCG